MDIIEFERREAHLSGLDDGPPFTVHGVAIGDNDVTVGSSGIKKLWPAEELKESAHTLSGRNLVVDHNNRSEGVIGTVTKAGYKEGVGVIYEAELFDEELAEKIANGLLEVSVRGLHIDVDEMEENEDGAKIVENIIFENLSIVPNGASPSNTIEMGSHENLSAAELRQYTGELEEDNLQIGDYVTWDGNYGIIIDIDGDDSVVDVYGESDGKWRSTGEDSVVSTDSLSSWNVDEDDIGPMKSAESDESEDESNDDSDDSDNDASLNISQIYSDYDYLTNMTSDELQRWSENPCSRRVSENAEDVLRTSVSLLEQDESSWTDNDAKNAQNIVELINVTLNEVEPPSNPRDGEEGCPSKWAMTLLTLGHNPFNNLPDVPDGLDRMDSVELSRVEGEEEPLDTPGAIRRMKENSPERFIPDELGDSLDEDMQNVSDEEELQEWEMHKPQFDGTTEEEWSKPTMDDFDTDDLGQIADHFIISSSGFPPENFGDLALPVVEPSGELNLNALSAVKGGRGVSAVDNLSDNMSDDIVSMVNDLAEKHFDRDWSEENDEEESGSSLSIATPVQVLTGDDLRSGDFGESELDSTHNNVITMTSDIEDKIAELNEPVAVEKSELTALQDKADRFEEMSGSLEALRERTEVLDEVNREMVEELRDADEPMVIESSRYESLSEEAEQVKGVYAAALAEEVGAFTADELKEKFTIEELRSKYEEHIGDLEEELSAEPRSGDLEEEELESTQTTEEAEKSEEVSQKQEELRNKIFGGK